MTPAIGRSPIQEDIVRPIDPIRGHTQQRQVLEVPLRFPLQREHVERDQPAIVALRECIERAGPFLARNDDRCNPAGFSREESSALAMAMAEAPSGRRRRGTAQIDSNAHGSGAGAGAEATPRLVGGTGERLAP